MAENRQKTLCNLQILARKQPGSECDDAFVRSQCFRQVPNATRVNYLENCLPQVSHLCTVALGRLDGGSSVAMPDARSFLLLPLPWNICRNDNRR